MELVSINMLMEISIWDNGSKIHIMEKVSWLKKMDKGMKDK